MLGRIAEDIIGSAYEFNNYRAKNFAPLYHPKAKFTDDTVCIVAVADALVSCTHPAQSLHYWGRKYWHNGGWGQRFAHWLANDNSQPYSGTFTR